MTQIVYLIQTPLSERDTERFGIQRFLDRNVEVTVLDLTYYMDKYIFEHYVVHSQTAYPYVQQLYTYKEIKSFIATTSQNTVFISFIGDSSIKSLRVLRLLALYKKKFGIIFSGSLPSAGTKQNVCLKLKLLSFSNLKRLFGKAFYLLFSPKIDYSFVIASGQKSLEIINKKYRNSAIIQGHAFDYDLYLENQRSASSDKEYILFLDEYFPFHPDYFFLRKDYTGLAEGYNRKLTRYFDTLENLFGIEVIIAAHPRSEYENFPDYWKGRKCIRGNTLKLVQNAKLCLLHASTSINFVVLYDKPSVFITMDEIKPTNIQMPLEAMAKAVNGIIVDLDNESSDTLDYSGIEYSYNDYKTNYIKCENSPDINNWDLLYHFYETNEEKIR